MFESLSCTTLANLTVGKTENYITHALYEKLKLTSTSWIYITMLDCFKFKIAIIRIFLSNDQVTARVVGGKVNRLDPRLNLPKKD